MKPAEMQDGTLDAAAGDGRQDESLADFRSSDADKRREMIALEAYYAAERRTRTSW